MWHWLLGWLFPIRCLGCGRYDVWLCAKCLASIPPQGYAVGSYQHEVLKKSIHALKYLGYREIAVVLGRRLAQCIPLDSYDIIVPVPLHWLRRLERGYNQAELLTQPFSKPVWPALRKIKRTAVQATLNRTQRQRNLIGVFQIHPAYATAIRDQRVLLVDDVYSTGSTAAACAEVLLSAGAAEVTVAVIAVNVPSCGIPACRQAGNHNLQYS